jgi:hypothetical protein
LLELAVSCFEICVSTCCPGAKGEQGPPGLVVPACIGTPQLVAGYIFQGESENDNGSGPGFEYAWNNTVNACTITFQGAPLGVSLASIAPNGVESGASWQIVSDGGPFQPVTEITIGRPLNPSEPSIGFSFVAVVCPTVPPQ